MHDAAPRDADAEQFDAVRAAARDGAIDRYLTALLAPRSVRHDLIALAAFAAEIDKISRQVQEPHLAEIRVQWWRDALSASSTQQRTGHPVADAFAQTIQRHRLADETLEDYFNTIVHRIYGEPPQDETQLSVALDLTEGALFACAAQILGATQINVAQGTLHDAAQAYGRAKLGLGLPYALARDRVPVPLAMIGGEKHADWRAVVVALSAGARVHLKAARSAYATEQGPIKAALLPVALVEPYLRALTRAGHDPARDIADIAPLTRTWLLAKTHVVGRF